MGFREGKQLQVILNMKKLRVGLFRVRCAESYPRASRARWPAGTWAAGVGCWGLGTPGPGSLARRPAEARDHGSQASGSRG